MKPDDVSVEFSGRDAVVAEFVALAAADHALGSQQRWSEVGLLFQPQTLVYLHNLIVGRMRGLKKILEPDAAQD